jgi:gluconolactonase
MTPLLHDLEPVGRGVGRPEDVHVDADGRVFVSDAGAAISEILPDGGLRRIGAAGGEPNGFALLADGTAVLANFALGVLQRVDLATGGVEPFVDAVDGEPLGAVNYPLADRAGNVWVSSSSRGDPIVTLATGEPDGFVFRVDAHGRASMVLDRIAWPNCMTFDDDERHLYVCRSAHADVVRIPVVDGGLGEPQRYGPALGGRGAEEFGPNQLDAFADPETLHRWAFTDGCAFDADGNLWVTLLSANRIVMITPDERVVTVIDDPDGTLVVSPTSVAFGGDDLRDVYIGSLVSDYVVKARSAVPGRPPR